MWGLPSPPDMVTFSKKLQVGGYYSVPGLYPKEVGGQPDAYNTITIDVDFEGTLSTM